MFFNFFKSKKNIIKKYKILIWTTCNKNSFCEKHKLNKKSNNLQDEFKDINFTNFNFSQKDLFRNQNDPLWTERILEKLKVESFSSYDVIFFDLKCLLVLPIDFFLVNFLYRYWIETIFLRLIEEHKDKTFLILNAHLEDGLDSIFKSNNVFNLEKKRSSQIQSINKTNINGEIVSYYCLNDQEIRKDQNIKKYRSLWHATGNKNEITGFQVDNMYFLPFGCDALASILKNINLLLDDSNEFNKEKVFHLLKTKDTNFSLQSLPIIDNLWKKHLKKKELNKNLSKANQELAECVSKTALLLKALEYQGKSLELIIEKILENFNFEILPQNKKNKDQADIIFSFNYKRSKYTTIVEVKGYGKNKIERKPFDQVKLWHKKFIKENPEIKLDKTIKLVVVNNKLSDYDQRNVKISENIKKHYDFPKNNSSNSNNANEGVKFITTLNLIKILYSYEKRGAELLKEKLVSTETMEIELD